MKITKIGHCCLFIEEGNLKILTDPGAFSVAQNHWRKPELNLLYIPEQILAKNSIAFVSMNEGDVKEF